jgi:RNA polymerase sigma-70 factor (ECF subfamily)
MTTGGTGEEFWERERSGFPTTHWSLVNAAGHGTGKEKREALAELLSNYRSAMRSFLLNNMRIDPGKVDDLLQRFLADRVLETDLIARVERERGRFRSFLVASLQRFVLNCLREERAKKRSPASLESLDSIEVAGQVATPLQEFELEWAREVLDQAIEQMRDECRASARMNVWGVFEGRVLGPTLRNSEPVAYAELMTHFDFKSPAQASNMLITANRMFLRILRVVIGRYEKSAEEIDEEIADLKRILSSPRRNGA